MAKEALKGNWLVAIVAGILAGVFGATTVNGFALNLSFNFSAPQPEGGEAVPTAFNMGADLGYNELWTILSLIVLGLGLVYSVFVIIQFTIGSAVCVGYSQFNLDLVDGCDTKLGTLFSRMRQMKTAIGARLLSMLYVLLGYICFIIPGIMATYSYSMVFFVLAENPEMTAREALKESKRIMKGHRWQLFCLEISFIGWILLSILTLGIALIWVMPYTQAAYASFYRNAKDEADYIVY